MAVVTRLPASTPRRRAPGAGRKPRALVAAEHSITVRLTDHELALLDAVATSLHTTRAGAVRRVLVDYGLRGS